MQGCRVGGNRGANKSRLQGVGVGEGANQVGGASNPPWLNGVFSLVTKVKPGTVFLFSLSVLQLKHVQYFQTVFFFPLILNFL